MCKDFSWIKDDYIYKIHKQIEGLGAGYIYASGKCVRKYILCSDAYWVDLMDHETFYTRDWNDCPAAVMTAYRVILSEREDGRRIDMRDAWFINDGVPSYIFSWDVADQYWVYPSTFRTDEIVERAKAAFNVADHLEVTNEWGDLA